MTWRRCLQKYVHKASLLEEPGGENDLRANRLRVMTNRLTKHELPMSHDHCVRILQYDFNMITNSFVRASHRRSYNPQVRMRYEFLLYICDDFMSVLLGSIALVGVGNCCAGQMIPSNA